MRAHIVLQRARLAALRGEADPPFDAAVTALREAGEPFWVANALLEQAEWLAGHDGADEIAPLLDEAREVFTRLRVPPRLERCDRLDAMLASTVG